MRKFFSTYLLFANRKSCFCTLSGAKNTIPHPILYHRIKKTSIDTFDIFRICRISMVTCYHHDKCNCSQTKKIPAGTYAPAGILFLTFYYFSLRSVMIMSAGTTYFGMPVFLSTRIRVMVAVPGLTGVTFPKWSTHTVVGSEEIH